ncbi:MAG: VIT1/CCC1 transporter family protein [Deltaproteobacteria bacterium]|nr:VIT1/CCC1 transporter family protein [Deltaproteobacteria bacterium]MBW2361693.1 VIT1/CCC1 transporter family protein [Deltaproteobacteria bacterium]
MPQQTTRLARENIESAEQWHKRTNVREIVFGFNDGAISILALTAGAIGGALSRGQATVAALSGVIGGAISMGIGAYISSKSEIEHHRAEIVRERQEIIAAPEVEREELRQIYLSKAPFTDAELEIILDRICGDPDTFLAVMMEEELGLFEDRFESPMKVAGIMFAAFLAGGFFPLIPFSVVADPLAGLVAASCATFLALFFIGVWKTGFTLRHWFASGMEMVGVGVLAAVIPYLLGDLLLRQVLAFFAEN